MIAAAVLDALLAAGATAEMIVAAVKADAAIEQQSLDNRRAKDAERQRRHRSRGVTVTNGDSTDQPLSPFAPPNVSPDPIKITPPISPIPGLVVSVETTPPAEQIEDSGVKPEHVIEAWNMTAEPIGLQRVRKLTPERRRKLNTFIRRHSIDEITEGIAAIPRSPFLRGENPRGWRADFDWMLEPKNFTKLQEGNYDR